MAGNGVPLLHHPAFLYQKLAGFQMFFMQMLIYYLFIEMKTALTIYLLHLHCRAWYNSVQLPVHISRWGCEEFDKGSYPEDRKETDNLELKSLKDWLILKKKQSYHSNVEIDTHPIHPLCMLMVVLRKKRFNVAALCFPHLIYVRGEHLCACVPS